MESRTFKCKGERNDHTLHYEQVFGDVFKRTEIKCQAVLMKHCLQMVQQLKTKNINDTTGQLFCCQYKTKFLLETDSLY